MSYDLGCGVKIDIEKAVGFYMKSIKYENSVAMYNLALIYATGKGRMEINFPESIRLYSQAVEYGLPEAMNNLANIYKNGRGEPNIDVEKIMNLYQLSVKYKNPSAMYNLALIYEKGWKTVKSDFKKSIELYELSSFYGYPDSMNKLGCFYEKGENGVEIDLEKSASYFFKAYQKVSNTNYLDKFLNILKNNKLEWIPEYHIHWNGENGLDSQIITLLLISKFRFSSIFNFNSIKGIVMSIIKYLCHFQQINMEDEIPDLTEELHLHEDELPPIEEID